MLNVARLSAARVRIEKLLAKLFDKAHAKISSIMAVRTFTMPESGHASVTSPQPPLSDASSSLLYNTEHKPANPHERQNGITFEGQDKLPKLPIPDLESTCKNYLEALKPLQTKWEQNDTAAAVQEFLRDEGPELQSRLKKYASGKTSYIEQFCTSLSHTKYLLRKFGSVNILASYREF